jgi:hypothetical protein
MVPVDINPGTNALTNHTEWLGFYWALKVIINAVPGAGRCDRRVLGGGSF